jgi:hypothetical protein
MPEPSGENLTPRPAVSRSGPPPPPADADRDTTQVVGDGMARTSELLQRSIEARATERVTVAELLGTLGDRGFGLLIVILVLPNLIPGPPIPGFSLTFAAMIALVASQMVRGFARPQLPAWLLRRSFDRARLDAMLAHAMPYVRRFERFAHARPSWWTTHRGERWVGGLVIAIAVALAVPVPLGNTPPALSLLAIGLGLIERDTRLLLGGAIAGIASVAYVGVLTAMAVIAAEKLFG